MPKKKDSPAVKTPGNNNAHDHHSTNSSVQQLGYDEWFQEKRKELPPNDFSVARITTVNRNNYKISNGQDDILAELSGKFLFNAENSLDFPTVGDWVVVQYLMMILWPSSTMSCLANHC